LHALAATSTGGAIMAGRLGQKAVPLAQRAVSALSVGSGSEQSPTGGSQGTEPGPSSAPPQRGQGPGSTAGDRKPGSSQPSPGQTGGRPPRSPGSKSAPPGGPGGQPGPNTPLASGGEATAGAAI